MYLEDSYVLGIESDDRSVHFLIDLVLTPEHPDYRSPGPDEQYCYRRAQIAIENARSVRWLRKTMQPFEDATGEVDYGSIDSWTLDGDVSHIEGDSGRARGHRRRHLGAARPNVSRSSRKSATGSP